MTSIASSRRNRLMPLLLSALILVACATSSFAQDSAQVLRLSVGFGTLKNSATMSDETRAEVDRLSKLATEANAERRYGDALKHMYHGMALMRGQQWTPSRALSTALTLKLDKTLLEPTQTVRVHIGQLFQLDEKVGGSVAGRIALFAAKGDEKTPPLKVLQNLDGVFTDFSLKPYDVAIVVPDLEDGKYRVEISFKPADGEPITRSAAVRIERGLAAKVAASKDRAARIESMLKASKNDRLLAALATPAYQISLFDLANAGEINFDRIDFDGALKEAGTMLDAIEAGRDPFPRRGDFKKAYRSKVDDTLQPYRLFVPAGYDGSKPFPLVIALHGMGGDENSYFEAYANGAIKAEAEKRGYILACPKGRQPASMYMGSAEKDVLDVLAEMQRAYRIDPDRVYLTGHSMGGFGTWSVAMNHPELFAALAPVAGGGNPMGVRKIAHIPELVVHGDDDKTVPVARSRTMVAAAKEAGAEVKYIEVPGGSHLSIVVPTFKDVFDWFDTHARKPVEVKAGSAQQQR